MTCASCGESVSGSRCEKCGAAVRCGKYQVLKVLAQTPHSRAYVATDETGRKWVLKELLFATVPTLQQIEAFEREGRMLQQLDHPQIPRFLEGEGAATRLIALLAVAEAKLRGAEVTRG